MHPCDAGFYSLRLSNAFGMLVTEKVRLAVTELRPAFLTIGTTLSPEGFRLRLGGLSGGFPVIIYAGTNLVDWWPIHTNPPFQGVLEHLDPSATNLDRRFYHAAEQR